MKTLLIVFIIGLIGSTACAQKRGYHNFGNLRGHGMLVNNKKDGVWIYEHPNGKKAIEVNYSKGLKNGHEMRWDYDGRLSSEIDFVNDTIVGNGTYWMYDSTFTTGSMVHDGMDKEWVHQKVSGEILSISYKNNGKLNGKLTAFVDGKEIVTNYYDHGIPTGTWIYQGGYARELHEEHTFNSGKLVLLIQRNELGGMVSERKFADGKMTSEKCWDDDGILKEECPIWVQYIMMAY